jgi:hypothetical protein
VDVEQSTARTKNGAERHYRSASSNESPIAFIKLDGRNMGGRLQVVEAATRSKPKRIGKPFMRNASSVVCSSPRLQQTRIETELDAHFSTRPELYVHSARMMKIISTTTTTVPNKP